MESISDQFQDEARDLESRVGPQIEEARRNLNDLNKRIATFIRERPAACLLGALALGFIVGRIASR